MPNIVGTSWGETPSILGDAGGVVTWSIAPGGLGISRFAGSSSPSVDGDSFLDIDFVAEMSQALAQWSNAGNIEFMQIEDSGGGAGTSLVADIRIFFGPIAGNTIGFAFFPTRFESGIAGDVLLDTALDLGRFPALLIHEFGHALGLDHLPNGSRSVMTPTVLLDTLQADDIDGITQIYGAQDNAPTTYAMPDTLTDLNILESPFQVTVTGNDLGNMIDGTSAAETILGGAGNDRLFGRGSDDVLTGGTGNDVIDGGMGEDTLVLDRAFADVQITRSGGVVSITSGGETDTIQNVENFQFTDGTRTSDQLILPVTLIGTDDDDVLTGAGGYDVLSGGIGDDVLNGLDGNDRLVGGVGGDTLNGGDGSDTLNAGDGDDFIFGGDTSADLRDLVYAGAGNDSIDGGYGNDNIFGQDGNDTIIGGFGSDTLQGQDGDDVLTGSALSDLVFGNAGDDFVNGGFGHDRINGGTGADRFFHLGIFDHGSDWIQDYSAAEGDLLLFGNASATATDFQVNYTHTASPAGERSGDDDVQEAFVIYRPTGQIMWALVDGAGQTEINLRIGSETFDLLA